MLLMPKSRSFLTKAQINFMLVQVTGGNTCHPTFNLKSTFGGTCTKKLRECQNVLNNQFKGILGKFLQGDAPKA
jgi:hypothetical protein